MGYKNFNAKTTEEFTGTLEELGLKLPLASSYEALKAPIKIGSKTAAHRIAYHPMEGCDGTPDGSPDVLTKRRYDRFAKGGPAVVWFEAVAISNEGRANPRQLFLHEENLDEFSSIVENIKQTCYKENGYEPIVIMQATHSGRYSRPNRAPAPIIAYNNPIFEKDAPIAKDRIITDERLKELEQTMGVSAALAVKAGFDGVDIKACHRYLNSELLSAYTREGSYGGSFENRTRFFLNCVRSAKASVPSAFIVTTRMNAYDGFPYPYGFGVEENKGIELCLDEPKKIISLLKAEGVGLVNITMGNPYFNPHVNRPYESGGYEPPEHPLTGVCRMINGIGELKKAEPSMLFVSTGFSYLKTFSALVGAGAVEQGMADFMGVGRMSFANPDFAVDAIKNDTVNSKKVCLVCSKCTKIMRAEKTPGCPVRDSEIYMPLFKEAEANI